MNNYKIKTVTDKLFVLIEKISKFKKNKTLLFKYFVYSSLNSLAYLFYSFNKIKVITFFTQERNFNF